VAIALTGSDGDRLNRIFNELAEGGRIQMPLSRQPWGGEAGWLTDRFGIQWTVSIDPGVAASDLIPSTPSTLRPSGAPSLCRADLAEVGAVRDRAADRVDRVVGDNEVQIGAVRAERIIAGQ
jgi:hypothetical protein